MASITGLVGRYSGTVTFTDNTKEYFHCQIENDRMWAVNPDGSSHATQEKIRWYNKPGSGYIAWVRQLIGWARMPFLSNAFISMTPAPIDKEINDIVLRAEFTFALDDNTWYPVTMVYDSWGGFQWLYSGTMNARNLGVYVTKIQNMLKQIVDIAVLIPAA